MNCTPKELKPRTLLRRTYFTHAHTPFTNHSHSYTLESARSLTPEPHLHTVHTVPVRVHTATVDGAGRIRTLFNRRLTAVTETVQIVLHIFAQNTAPQTVRVSETSERASRERTCATLEECCWPKLCDTCVHPSIHPSLGLYHDRRRQHR